MVRCRGGFGASFGGLEMRHPRSHTSPDLHTFVEYTYLASYPHSDGVTHTAAEPNGCGGAHATGACR
jgi:hypothetical protein